jgi:hypothetical protein
VPRLGGALFLFAHGPDIIPDVVQEFKPTCRFREKNWKTRREQDRAVIRVTVDFDVQ